MQTDEYQVWGDAPLQLNLLTQPTLSCCKTGKCTPQHSLLQKPGQAAPCHKVQGRLRQKSTASACNMLCPASACLQQAAGFTVCDTTMQHSSKCNGNGGEVVGHVQSKRKGRNMRADLKQGSKSAPKGRQEPPGNLHAGPVSWVRSNKLKAPASATQDADLRPSCTQASTSMPFGHQTHPRSSAAPVRTAQDGDLWPSCTQGPTSMPFGHQAT